MRLALCRRFVPLLVLCWVVALVFSGACGRAETADGFVTKVDSSKEFDVGTLHVGMDGKTQCRKEDLRSNIELQGKVHGVLFEHHYLVLRSQADAKTLRRRSCGGLRLKVGSRVEVVGDAEGGDGRVLAARVTVYAVETRQNFEGELTHRTWVNGALLEEKPEVTRKGQGWAGTMWLDGYPVSITPETKLLTAPSGTQMSYGDFGFLEDPRMGANVPQPHLPAPAFSAALFAPNTWVTYRGIGMVHSPPMLYRLRLWANEVGADERKYWAQLAPAVRAPDYANRTAGSAVFPRSRAGDAVAIVPDQGVQEFVSKVGESLVPEYQKALPDSDATKIRFRFYVARAAGAAWAAEARKRDELHSFRRPGWEAPTVALPDGAVFVSDVALARIGNEAQLAALLSCAITSVLQKQSYLPRHPHESFSISDFDDDTYPDYQWLAFILSRSEQALRIGIRQMYLAGYDVREAPYAWAAEEGVAAGNPVIGSESAGAGVPWYAAYGFDYLRRYYSDVDYGALKRGEAEYAEFLGELRKGDAEAFAGAGERK